MSEKTIALSHSKHRNMIGLIGIEVDENLIVHVRAAKQWSRSQINQIPQDLKDTYDKIKWSRLYVDQVIGEHFINDINRVGLRTDVITTKKNLDEPDDIERLQVMDKIEMTQLMLSLKLDHRIQFPINPTGTMKEAISQVELFTEHKTEAGGIDYYSPGEELDSLTKSLMICCFAVRKILAGNTGIHYGGAMKKKDKSFDDVHGSFNILDKRGLSTADYR